MWAKGEKTKRSTKRCLSQRKCSKYVDKYLCMYGYFCLPMPYGFRISFNFGLVGFDRLCCSKTDDGCRCWCCCCFWNTFRSTVDAFWLSFIHEFSLFFHFFKKSNKKIEFMPNTRIRQSVVNVPFSYPRCLQSFVFWKLVIIAIIGFCLLCFHFPFYLTLSLPLFHSHSFIVFVLTVTPRVVILSNLYFHGEHVFVCCSAFVLLLEISASRFKSSKNNVIWQYIYRKRLTPEPKLTTNEWKNKTEKKRKKKNSKYNTIFSRALFLYSLLFCVCVCTTCICLRMWNWNKIQLHCVEHLRAHMCGAKALYFPWC